MESSDLPFETLIWSRADVQLCGWNRQQFRFTSMAIVVLAMALMFEVEPVAQAQNASGDVQVWLDDSGAHKIEAKFVKLEGENVVLETPEGKVLNVPLAKLSLSSQLKAKKLVDPKAFVPPQFPSSMAPPPLRQSPFPANATLEQFLDVFFAEIKAEHADVLWHALPVEMQSDVEAVVIRSAELAGPKFFKQLQAVLPNVLTIIREKRSFILGSRALSTAPDIKLAMGQILPALEPTIEVLTRPATWSNSNFKQGQVGPWLVTLNSDLEKANKALEAVIKQSQTKKGATVTLDLKKVSYKVIDKSTDAAKVEFTSEGNKAQVLEFKKVGHAWLPKDFADGWQENMAATRAYLDGMDKAAIDELRTNLSRGLTFINGIVGGLSAAKSQQEFNQMSDPFMGALVQMLRSRTQPGAGQPGYPGGMPSPGASGLSGSNSGSLDVGATSSP